MHNNTTPLWRTDMLACYGALLDKLNQIDTIKKVYTATALADLDEKGIKRAIDGGVYVIFDSITPIDISAQNTVMQLGFSVVLAAQNVLPTPKMAGVGRILTDIACALQGFMPTDTKGRMLTLSPFLPAKGLPMRYSQGFGFYALRFTTTVAVVAD